jgi:AP endonuclease 2
MNPPGMFEEGQRRREPSSKDLLPFSGKLLPEFDRRRSIKDMFRKQTNVKDEKFAPSRATPSSDWIEGESQKVISGDSKDNTSQATDTTATSQRTMSSEAYSLQRGDSSVIQQTNGPPSKKRKPNPTSKESNGSANNQKTLKSFFQPKQSKGDTTPQPSSNRVQTPSPSKTDTSPSKMTPKTRGSSLLSNDSPNMKRIIGDSQTQETESDSEALKSPPWGKFVDPEETRMGWTKIFSKRDAPRCEGHIEPCINLETKKKGVNCGRRFWICPR